MAWIDIPDSLLDAESEIRDDAGDGSVFLQMNANVTAWRLGSAGAPKLTGPAWADNSFNANRFAAASFTGDLFEDESIVQTRITASACGQAEIKDTYGEINLYSMSGSSTEEMMLNAAGEQMLGYETKWSQTGPIALEYYRFGFPGLHAIQAALPNVVSQMTNTIATESWIYLFVSAAPAGGWPILRINFVSASPPYKLNGRECRLFVYMRQRPDGSIASSWVSPCPPWAYNGPHSVRPDLRLNGKQYQLTSRRPVAGNGPRATIQAKRETRAELVAVQLKHADARAMMQTALDQKQISTAWARKYRISLARDYRANLERLYELHELTPERKNLDLPLYPQPFGPHPRSARIGDDRVILLDPSDRMADDLLLLHENNESIGEAIGRDYLRVGDELAGAPAPAGIPAVSLQWKATA